MTPRRRLVASSQYRQSARDRGFSDPAGKAGVSSSQRVPQREEDHNYSLRKGLSWMNDVLEDQPDRYYGFGRHHPDDRCSLED
jgi:hypothetical protein